MKGQLASTTADFTKTADDFYQSTLEDLGTLPGMTIAIIKGDETIYLRGFGYADLEKKIKATPETAFYIASSTKSFTALLASLMDQQGTLSLEQTLGGFYPNVDFHEKLQADQITVRHLLAHTSGLSNSPIGFRAAYSGEHDPKTMENLLVYSKPNDAGFNQFQYSNVGYNIYTMMLDKKTGQPWQDLLEQYIFQPLGMSHTSAYVSRMEQKGVPMSASYFCSSPDNIEEVYLRKQDNTMQSAGGMVASAKDLANWLKIQVNLGRLNGKQVFPEALIKQSHQPISKETTSDEPFQGIGYGLGWQIGTYNDEKVIWHHGGFAGYRTHISFMPDQKIGIAVMANEAVSGGRLMDQFATFAYDYWLGVKDFKAKHQTAVAGLKDRVSSFHERYQKDLEGRGQRTWQLSKSFDTYSGVYQSKQYGTIQVKGDGQKMHVKLGNMHCYATPYTKAETIRVELNPGRGEVIQFVLEEGQAVQLHYDGEPFERVGK